LTDSAVIRVERVHKKFCRNLRLSMAYGMRDVLRGLAGLPGDSGALRKDEFWAVDDVSFEVRRGEAFGILGLNGSGKSTLLRLITGIFPPDKGRIEIRGRVGALIAVGAGFHPHMSGRENVFLNGTILGMKRREIEAKYASIVDFADIGDFIDSPVASYSSGMKVRLGFAIAIHAPIEILIADEILAVGDVFFKKKCFEKIIEMKKSGVTILFVSHSLFSMQSICDRGLVLHHGKQVISGNIRSCIKEYMSRTELQNKRKETFRQDGEWRSETGVGNVLFSGVRVYEEGGDPDRSDIEFGKNVIIEFAYRFKEKKADDYQLRLGFKTHEGQSIQKFTFQEAVFSDGVVYKNEKIVRLGRQGKGRVRVICPKLFPQTIHLTIGVKEMKMGIHEGGLFNAATFRIVEPRNEKMHFEHGFSSITEFDYDIEILDAEEINEAGLRPAERQRDAC